MRFDKMPIAVLLFSVTIYSFASQINAQTSDCYQSQIMEPTPFMGNNDEIFKLADGSIWQIRYEYEYMYEYYPTVIMCPGRQQVIVDGKRLNVAPISTANTNGPQGNDVIKSQISGDFEGWEGDTIYQLTNGQVWQQVEYKYSYAYKYMPRVMIYKRGSAYYMVVDNEEPVKVVRIN